MAQDEDGAYYSVSEESFDELSIDLQVEVSWNGNQEESNPPQRMADMIVDFKWREGDQNTKIEETITLDFIE
ncbi:hypothetical protein [Alkalibacillus haloalkaliphilus]|uniref:hypothetical protein n=1 Tax=Alkalibacillus haloalkaliphilus TaxID=94136 RepID=UPI0002D400D6|nr:hypothetical protein [Alkalibacillus haloalkaliphilus]